MVSLIQQELEITLPPSCAQYFSAFPFAPNSFVVWAGLTFEPHKVIESTKWNRANGFFDQSWPHNYLVIGSNTLGNEFFVDVTEANSPVFLADHERCNSASTLGFEQCDRSLSAWIESMHETEATTPDWLKSQVIQDM